MKQSHCAMREVAQVLEKGPPPRIISGMTESDPHAEYDNTTKTITVNTLAYLHDPDNLARVLYHEGLHYLEFSMGLRKKYEYSMYHDSTRIPIILKALLKNPDHPCLKQVRNDGTLLNSTGAPYEPNYDKVKPVEPIDLRSLHLDSLSAPLKKLKKPDFDHSKQ
ncbi:MAG: hypothetical protein HY399_00540 [Elusimicrobia bacterium]|nr:hypothetical protein [Elusimicrobiota bacterium]